MDLIIGLGGFGTQAANEIYKSIRNRDTYICCIDTDICICADYPETLNISVPPIILNEISHINNPLIKNINTANGSGQTRTVANICYQYALKNGKLNKFMSTLENVAVGCLHNDKKINVTIITSLVGGTGAGIFLQIALLTRHFIENISADIQLEITGHFALCGVFGNFCLPLNLLEHMKAVAYASLKELYSINEMLTGTGNFFFFKFSNEDIMLKKEPFDKFYLYGVKKDYDKKEIISRISATLTENVSRTICFSAENRFDISRVLNFSYNDGDYFKAYRNVINNSPSENSLHLAEKYEKLPDIGEKAFRRSQNKAMGSSSKLVKFNLISDTPSVFISYSTKNVKVAEQLKDILINNGIECWMAPTSIPPGSDYCFEIPQAIKNCKAVVLVLSEESQLSNWVPKEIGCAINKGKVVIPFHIDESLLNDVFDFMLSNSQRIEAYNRLSEAFGELVQTLLFLTR